MNLDGKRILLGVTGSIAAYKAADIASKLARLGAEIFVVLTPSAERFVGAATFRALTRNPVMAGVFDEPFDSQIAHIQLSQESDLILVAPATANLLAKMALGIADDLLSTILLAAAAPVMVAPAMNVEMLRHPATQANIGTLTARGVETVEPAYGTLACGTEGWGKLADTDKIVEAVIRRLTGVQDLQGVRVLVTAGATREPLDPVRFLSNRSSGRMGFALAEAARDRGASVTVIAAHTTIDPPQRVRVVDVSTTDEMLEAACERFEECDLFIAAAAPADFSPVSVAPAKIKKETIDGEWTVRLKETPDVVATLASRKTRQLVVGFAAETDALIENARAKLARKQLDMIVANDVTAKGAGFEVETNVVTLIRPDGATDSLPLLSKREVADRILDALLAAGLRPPTPPMT
jgi:phosphopantothenoylcysteine decarboxylase / phosphopantothenate---cysteine ligase